MVWSVHKWLDSACGGTKYWEAGVGVGFKPPQARLAAKPNFVATIRWSEYATPHTKHAIWTRSPRHHFESGLTHLHSNPLVVSHAARAGLEDTGLSCLTWMQWRSQCEDPIPRHCNASGKLTPRHYFVHAGPGRITHNQEGEMMIGVQGHHFARLTRGSRASWIALPTAGNMYTIPCID